MMLKLVTTCGLLILSLVLLTGNVQSTLGATPADFLGTWVNVDPDTRGVTRLVIASVAQGYTVQGFGKCSPNDCDWGATSLNLLGYSISDQNPNWGIATWVTSFKDTTLVIRLDGDQLLVEDYNVFKDNSGRSNYRSFNLFRKG